MAVDESGPVNAVRSLDGAYLARRFQAWADARQPRTDTLRLTQRNIYILPTRAGWMFALTLVVLLLASINYQLNLGYLLTFLLAGSGLVSMHVTHATLRDLTLHLKPIEPVFAGDTALLDVVLTSDAAARHGIGLKLSGSADATRVWLDVPARGQAPVRVGFVATRRGRDAVPTLTADTRFPLGLFRAWTIWRPATQLLTYPRLEAPAPPLPPLHATPDGPGIARSSDGGEVEGVRAYRRGDPMKLVAWKKAAKSFESGGELVSRDTIASARRELWLDWHATGTLAPEERLSRLAAWVLAADRAGVEYGLRLPEREMPLAHGDAHRHRCLEALARWPD